MAVHVSKHPHASHLCFTAGEWLAFKGGVHKNDFDNLG